MSDVLILGGGVSGLAAAYFFSRRGVSSTILEPSGRIGGLIQTERLHGCELEAGPDSYIAAKTAVTDTAREIPGLEQQIIGSNDQARRIFLVKDGRLVAMPHGMVMMVPGEWGPALRSPLFGWKTKLHFLREYAQHPRVRNNDISIADFIGDHFDDTILEYVTEPLLTGVYGGSAAQLSAKSVLPRFLDYEEKYGSLIRGVRQERARQKRSGSLFHSFQGGMQTFTDALFQASGTHLTIVHGAARHVERNSGKWRIQTEDNSFTADHLVSAVPSHVAAGLFDTSVPELSAELAQIPYSSSIIVVAGYRKSMLGHALDGFGFLVPRKERRLVAAATWVNTKFPERVAEGIAVLRAFLVDSDAEQLMAAGDSEILAVAQREFTRLMGIETEPEFYRIHRWPNSMPQYCVGHGARYRRIIEILKDYPQLSLIGNAFDGVGIPDAVRLAKSAVDRYFIAGKQ